MRVLFYHTGRSWTGSSRAFAVAARGLQERGEQVTVVCRTDTPAEQAFARDGIDVVALPVSDAVTRDAWRLRTVLKEKFTEVILVHSEQEQLVVSSAMRMAERGGVIRRIPAGGRLVDGRGARWAGRMATARPLFSTMMDRQRANLPDALIAPLGVDVARVEDNRDASRALLGIEPETQLIVCVADRTMKPRVTTALRTLALLAERHPDLRLALVGSGDDDDTHMHAAALGVTPLVRFLGERDDMAAVVGAADVGWVAADGDDGAFACLDFMAARVPVIAERSPLLSHYVPDGISGVLLPPAAPSDTAATVANFLADNNQRAAMGKAGRTRVARDFPESAMIEGFVAAAAAAGDRASWAAQ
ncbi:MAG: glycosyltransferase family 4 protein [Gemmatimonadota bacterium]|nr:glycosyltransferase family 4 protein [Gemmatimonadota bacterium]